MDNAMVKRGIGAVVLAIIAALLLGYLLKDKSRERQEVVDMKLPGAPEITIPSLSEATSKVTDSAASLVGETKDSISNASSAVIASATGTFSKLGDGTANAVAAVTDDVKSTANAVKQSTEEKITETESANTGSSNPGFSFRPPAKDEEQQINTTSSASSTPTSTENTTEVNTETSNNTVVASTQKSEEKPKKKFKPTIENEPKKAAKKVVKKKPKAKKEAPKTASKPSKSTSSKYAIQLLATSSQSRANKLAKTMNGEGYVSFITQTTSNNKILYRVRVGGHKDRNSALSAQQSMKRRYQKNFFVQNSLVVSQ